VDALVGFDPRRDRERRASARELEDRTGQHVDTRPGLAHDGGGAERRVPGEGQLLVDGEDAHPGPGLGSRAGLGQDEALRRGAAYAEAGADAVLIHSKEKTPAEILEFCKAWPGPVPLVLVPTAYPQLSFADIAALRKVGLIICANHAIRAAVAAMRAAFARILAEGGIAGVESSIASVADIFALQGDDHMRELESRFLR